MSYNDSNPREELYNRFMDSLRKPASERFFDEDELVEIFDYAGDVADEYARAEVLFCGARLYPDSEPLRERRALFYFDIEDAEKDLKDGSAAAFLIDNAEHSSMLFDIVRLEVNRPENPVAALEFLMEQYPRFSDEETIRFIDLAFDLDCYEWVIANMERLRRKATFTPALLHEVMHEADQKDDSATVALLAEELIEAEPFVFAYWAMLFRAQARLERPDDARQTFDTAKALGADDPAGLLSLADTVFNYAPYLRSESIEMLETLAKENPDNFTYTDCLCAFLVQNGESSRAMATVRRFIDEHPTDYRAVRQLLMCNISDADEIAGYYIDACADVESAFPDLDEIVNALLVRSAYQSIAGLFRAVGARRQLNESELVALAEAYFALGDFLQVAAIADGGIDMGQLLIVPMRGAAFVYMAVVAFMKLGMPDKAEDVLGKTLPLLESFMREAPLPIRMTIYAVVNLADRIRRHPASDTLYWEYFDMLRHGKFA